MNWIAILIIGLASGWALGLVLDFFFWGRRNRLLQDQLSACQSDVHAADAKLRTAQERIHHYQAKEIQYQQCQGDLTDLTREHDQLETQAKNMSEKLQTSHQTIDELDQLSSELRTELDQSQETLEDVDRLIETRARRRIWKPDKLRNEVDRIKTQSKAVARSVAANAGAKIRQAADRLNGSVSAVKAPIGRAVDRSRLVRFVKGGYCQARGLIVALTKKGEMPPSCSPHSK